MTSEFGSSSGWSARASGVAAHNANALQPSSEIALRVIESLRMSEPLQNLMSDGLIPVAAPGARRRGGEATRSVLRLYDPWAVLAASVALGFLSRQLHGPRLFCETNLTQSRWSIFDFFLWSRRLAMTEPSPLDHEALVRR